VRTLVCIKQVPDVAEIRFDSLTRTLVREGVPLITNPFDRPAIALAVDLKQRFGARTTVVTMGPPAAKEVLYEALASGVERAIHSAIAPSRGRTRWQPLARWRRSLGARVST
jgi:electron transfer flavoprotein beta subunit